MSEFPISRMTTPKSRSDFEHHFFLLAERINQDKLRLARGIRTDGLRRVRKLPNGRLDLLSIDEMTRLMANMCAQPPFEPQDGESMDTDPTTSDE